MKICLIRHGETDWNVIGKLQGREDVPLNSNGKLQASECGRYLRKGEWQAIVTSPLQRAKETAEIIANELGIDEIHEDTGLVERDFGKASGMMPGERRTKYPDGNYEDMESRDVMLDRMMRVLHGVAVSFTPNNLIVVSHGSAINSVLAELSNYEIGSGKTKLKNACVNLLEYDGENFQILFYNKSAEELEGILL